MVLSCFAFVLRLHITQYTVSLVLKALHLSWLSFLRLIYNSFHLMCSRDVSLPYCAFSIFQIHAFLLSPLKSYLPFTRPRTKATSPLMPFVILCDQARVYSL